jgi:hypothetical protein
MINHLRPINYYAMNVTYQCGKWNSSLLLNLFSGCDKDAFTNNNYIVADLSVNYKINTNKSVYLKVNNLTNEGYENMYYKYDGKTKVSKNKSRTIKRLTIAYIDVKGNNEIWNDDNKVIDYLIAHYSKRLRTIKMPLEDGWLSQSTIKQLTR